MSKEGMTELLYVISIPPSLDEQLVDWLLERDDAPGFTSMAVNGHGSDPSHLTVAEKVSGRQRRIQFQVQIAAADLEAFTAGLVAEFRGADLHYWAVPVVVAGSLRNVGASLPAEVPADEAASSFRTSC